MEQARIWKHSEIFTETLGPTQSMKQILFKNSSSITNPNFVSVSKLKKHLSIIDINKSILSLKQKNKSIEKTPEPQRRETHELPLLAPRLKPDHQEVVQKNVRAAKKHLTLPVKRKKFPFEMKRNTSCKHESMYDYVNRSNKFEGVVKKLGHERADSNLRNERSLEVHRITDFYNRFVYNSNVVLPKVCAKVKEQQLPPIDKVKNLDEIFNRAIKEFSLDEVEGEKDDYNLFDLYINK